jgi:hypothetical protein
MRTNQTKIRKKTCADLGNGGFIQLSYGSMQRQQNNRISLRIQVPQILSLNRLKLILFARLTLLSWKK